MLAWDVLFVCMVSDCRVQKSVLQLSYRNVAYFYLWRERAQTSYMDTTFIAVTYCIREFE